MWESQLQTMPYDQTTAGRVLHGSAIERSDVRVDSFDGHWLVQTRDREFPDELRGATPKLARSLWWKKLDKDAKSTPEWVEGERLNEAFSVKENGTHYLIDFSAGYSQGLFLDQRLNREKLLQKIQPGDRILNCFAYTCSFSVVTAQAGGIATSMDLSSRYLDWGKENFRLNQIEPDDHFFCKGDVMEWLKRFAKQDRTFRGVILDPPTFSRNGKKIFKVENDYTELVQRAVAVLDKTGGWLFCSTNHHSLKDWQFEAMLCEGVDLAERSLKKVESVSMPPEFEGDDYLKSFWLDVE